MDFEVSIKLIEGRDGVGTDSGSDRVIVLAIWTVMCLRPGRYRSRY
jgi:hypothetical protein